MYISIKHVQRMPKLKYEPVHYGGFFCGCDMCNCQQSKTEGLVSSVINVAKDAITGKPVKASQKIVSQRLTACSHCASLKRYYPSMPDGVAIIGGDRCLKCGCKVKLKASVASQRCPLGRWDDTHEDA